MKTKMELITEGERGCKHPERPIWKNCYRCGKGLCSNGNDYRIRVYDVSNELISDYSRYFSIYTPSEDTPNRVPGYDFLLIISIFGIISLVLMKKIKLYKE